MQPHMLLPETVGPVVAVVRGVRDDQLDEPTPCAEFDVRALVAHLLRYVPALTGAAHNQLVPAREEPDLASGDWRADLATQLDGLAAAWGRAGAWDGEASMGGQPIPAPMFGGMVVTEVVVHGWDLARATGQPVTWGDEVTAYVYREVGQTAGMGREMALYGPSVPVPADAPWLDRALGLTGRRPSWPK